MRGYACYMQILITFYIRNLNIHGFGFFVGEGGVGKNFRNQSPHKITKDSYIKSSFNSWHIAPKTLGISEASFYILMLEAPG